mmetsp:Transcript_34717/g.61076  ORF Transcript_34717/g.61076 Transcript_34717/m.61076 type:complete len:157 (+) Transcript_34717:1039-1509(+)
MAEKYPVQAPAQPPPQPYAQYQYQTQPPQPYAQPQAQSYPPQQPMYAAQPPPYQHIQMGTPLQQPVLVYTTAPQQDTRNTILGNAPVSMTCPYCKAQITTKTRSYPGVMAWLMCVLICLIGFWCGCCLIPLCIPGLQNVSHYCRNCSRFIGRKAMI